MQFFLFSSRSAETTTAKKRLHVTRVIRWETRLRRVQAQSETGEMKALCGNSSGNRSKCWKQKKRADKKEADSWAFGRRKSAMFSYQNLVGEKRVRCACAASREFIYFCGSEKYFCVFVCEASATS